MSDINEHRRCSERAVASSPLSEAAAAPHAIRGRLVIILGHGAALIAQGLEIALSRAGVDAVAVCDSDELRLQGVSSVVVCDTPAAQHVAQRLGLRPGGWNRIRVIALDSALVPDVDVRLPSTASADDLVELLSGASQPSDEVVRPRESRERCGSRERLMARLTRRETQVLALLMTGATNEQMASRLDCSPNTIRTHVQNVLTKMNARSRVEVAGIASTYGHPLTAARGWAGISGMIDGVH